VDGGCFSACEDFLIAFKDNRRATIVGEQTGGSTGQPFTKHFGNGMLISLSMRRVFMPNSSDFEGIGIIPDVEVPTLATDLRSGSDPVLANVHTLIKGSPPVR
jgi:carboxyl-terminal processing protease